MSVVVSRQPAFCNDYIHRDVFSRSCNLSSQTNAYVIDCNNNTTTTSTKPEVTSTLGFSAMGSGNIIRRTSPQTVQQHSPTTMSLQLASLGNVAGTNELTSPHVITTLQHPKLDRSMSEPIERSLTGRSNSFSSETLCNSTTNISSSSRYKTELCRPYEENGTCKYGDKCQFAHGMHEMRNLVRHPKYKTELCRTFHTSGFCPYGPRCHFIHNSEENRKLRSKSYSMDSTGGDITPDELNSQQKLFFKDDILYPSSFGSSQQSPSPPFNVSTLSESFTFAHHDYQQSRNNSILQLNNAYNRAQSPYNAALGALLAQQQNRGGVGPIHNDDDVFDVVDANNQGLDTPTVSDEIIEETARRVELLNLAVRMQGNGHFPLFNRYHNTSD